MGCRIGNILDTQRANVPRSEIDETDTNTTNEEVITSTENAIITDMVHRALCQIQERETWRQSFQQQAA